MPVGLEVCANVTGPATAIPCLDAIEAKLRADTIAHADGASATAAAFDLALEPMPAMLGALSVSAEFERSIGSGDDASASTDPISTLWRIAGEERMLWTCFADDGVTVSTADC